MKNKTVIERARKMRELKRQEALDYYFNGTQKIYPSLEKSLVSLVFGNWLQELVEGKRQLEPLRAVVHK